MSGKIVIVKPDADAPLEVRRFDGAEPDLKTLQGIVGGFIEHIAIPFEGRRRSAYVNEDGLSLNLPFNPTASMLTRGLHRIVGNMVIVKEEE